ncbi:MAG: hypothetical protein ACX94B_13845 [Henriciella sp.]|nr:hypothetical protein [Hyphomonadaceae bacterium]
MSKRHFQLVHVAEHGSAFDVMVFGGDVQDLQPLLIFHSIEFPVPPSDAFCDLLWDAGLQVIFVRRAGFGRSTPLPRALIEKVTITSGATAMAEAVMLRKLISTLDLKNIIVLAMGSSNPVIYRLVHIAPEITYTIFANPMFNQDIWQVFTPNWFRTMLKQIVSSKSGLTVAYQGMKLLIRKDPVAFYSHIYSKNAHDLKYIRTNEDDYRQAGEFALRTDAAQLYYDTMMCLSDDPTLKDGFFDGINGTALIGADSSLHWRNEMKREAARVGLPVIQAPKGDLFCAYCSPNTLLDLIQKQANVALLRVI